MSEVQERVESYPELKYFFGSTIAEEATSKSKTTLNAVDGSLVSLLMSSDSKASESRDVLCQMIRIAKSYAPTLSKVEHSMRTKESVLDRRIEDVYAVLNCVAWLVRERFHTIEKVNESDSKSADGKCIQEVQIEGEEKPRTVFFEVKNLREPQEWVNLPSISQLGMHCEFKDFNADGIKKKICEAVKSARLQLEVSMKACSNSSPVAAGLVFLSWQRPLEFHGDQNDFAVNDVITHVNELSRSLKCLDNIEAVMPISSLDWTAWLSDEAERVGFS